jgi:hypothetical protein
LDSLPPLQLPAKVLLLLEIFLEEVIFLYPLFLPLVFLPSLRRPILSAVHHPHRHGVGEQASERAGEGRRFTLLARYPNLPTSSRRAR